MQMHHVCIWLIHLTALHNYQLVDMPGVHCCKRISVEWLGYKIDEQKNYVTLLLMWEIHPHHCKNDGNHNVSELGPFSVALIFFSFCWFINIFSNVYF